MSHAHQSSWLLRALRWSTILVVVLGLLALISWLAVPPITKHLLEQQIEKQLGRKTKIADIAFNPLTFTLTVSDFTLYELDRTTPEISAKSLQLRTSLTSIYHLAPVLSEVKLIEPRVHIIRINAQGAGRYNFSDMLDRILAMPKSKENKPALFSVSNIQLENGAIMFDDQVTGKKIDIETLNIGVPYLSNFPSNVDIFVQPHLSATINGTPLTLQGRSKPFTSSQDTSLAIDIDQLDVASYAAFSPVALPLNIQSGKLSTKLDLSFSRNKNQPEVLLAGKIKLDDISLSDKQSAPLLKIQAVSTQIHKLNILTGSTALDQVDIQQPEVWASLGSKGNLNWAALNTSSAQPEMAHQAKAKDSKKSDTASPQITVAQLNIHDGIVDWSDAAHATPAMNLQVKNIAVTASALSLSPDAKPANISLSTGTVQDQHILFTGQISPAQSNVTGQINVDALSLAQYQPYINRALATNISGQLSLNTLIAVKDHQVQLQKLGLTLNDLKVTAKSLPKDPITIKAIYIENANLNTTAHTVSVDKLELTDVQGNLRRDAQGKLNIQQFLLAKNLGKTAVPKTTRKGATDKTDPMWIATLNQLVIADSHLGYLDNAVQPAVNIDAAGLNLTANNLSSKLDTPIQIDLKTKLNKTGKLAVSGSLAPQFKSINLVIDAQNLPITAAQPYYTDYLNILLASGQASIKGKLKLALPLDHQALAVNYTGAVQLGNVRALDKETSDDFLKWKTLDISGINTTVDNTHQNVSLAKISLDSFYARIILSDQAKLNLQDILVAKNTPADAPHPSLTSSTPTASTATMVSTNTLVPQASVSTPAVPTTATNTITPIIKIGQIALQHGNINYTDNFVKPNYTANLTNMNGTIGTIASDKPQPAPITLNGQIDNDAPVTISGTLNPLFKPMFLDIKASANGVELPRLTPYATKYAGYAIEKGKLSMDVTYHIENDKLIAQNNVRIDQLTFGDKIDSPTATKLPVLLAVALLKDRNGQININLPISGTLSDPDFSIGGIIVHIFINLITKAVTSPFALIGSAFGGGDELGYAEFAPGSAALTPATQSKLDTIAKALNDRPGLKMDLIGRVDPKTDIDGIRESILERKLAALKRKNSVDQGTDAGSDDTALTDADKNQYMGKIYSAAKFDKPHNFIGLNKSLPTADMEKLILANTTVTPDALSTLATQRAEAVRNYLEAKGQITPERLFLIAPKLNADGIEDKGKPNRVDFALK